jgi:hypothetical protein
MLVCVMTFLFDPKRTGNKIKDRQIGLHEIENLLHGQGRNSVQKQPRIQTVYLQAMHPTRG